MYIFSSYGFDAPIVAKQYKEYIHPKNKTILIVPFAGLNYSALARYEIKHILQYGFEENDIYVLDDSNVCDIISKSYNYIYVPGGNTFKLLSKIKELRISDWIKDQIKTGADYIGVSAGGYIACSNIEYLKLLEEDDFLTVTGDFFGLGLVTEKNLVFHSDQYSYHLKAKCKEFAPYKKYLYLTNTDVLVLDGEC